MHTATKQKPVIHTPDQRLRVFISSTLEELAEERIAAKKAIGNLHLTPVMFELGARPHPPRDLYSAYLEQSHVFIGIYGERYGWIVPGLGISGLEDEFQLSKNHPRLIYIRKNAPAREARLQSLIDNILNAGVSCKFYTHVDELCGLIENDLALLLTERFEHGGETSQAMPQHTDIPLPPTPLIGRDGEIAEIRNLLLQKETCLVTLTGTGGAGKTRLALEVARTMQSDFRDGVYFVPLASVNDAGLVPSTIVQTIFPGESGGQPPLQLLMQLISGKEILLALDNFEQVIGAAQFIAELLRFCERTKILVTSREALRISGEREFRVPMLPVPEISEAAQQLETLKAEVEKSPSVQLFVQRAQAINPAFSLTNDNAAAIAEICISLDGLPLAIELAAARIRVLTPQAMLPHLGKRLSLLTTGKRDMPERHRTLMATIDWSYLMLTPEEQQLLSKLSVFSGGCTLQSAYLVTEDEQVSPGECPRMAMYLYNPEIKSEPFPDADWSFVELMESLAAKNLIYCLEQAGEIRFMMYATIKEYALQKLSGSGYKEQIEKNHFNYFVRLAEALWTKLRSATASYNFATLDSELDNMREALRWGLENDPVNGLRIVLALGEYWDTRGMPDEQIWWTNAYLQKLESEKYAVSPVLVALAKMEKARAEFREGHHEQCAALGEETVALSKQLNDKYLFVDSTMIRGLAVAYTGDFESIKPLVEETLAECRKLNYKMAILDLLQNLAAAANFSGRFEESVRLTTEALALAEEMGAARWEAIAHSVLGFSNINLGNIETAAACFSKSLQCSKRFMDSILVIYPLIGRAQVALAMGNTDISIKLLAAVEKFCERKGTAIVPVVRQIVAFSQEAVKSQVGAEEYQRVYELGGRLQLAEAMEIA